MDYPFVVLVTWRDRKGRMLGPGLPPAGIRAKLRDFPRRGWGRENILPDGEGPGPCFFTLWTQRVMVVARA